MSNDLLDAALEYAERGWPIFPCQPNGKVNKEGKADKSPLTKQGVLDATTNPKTIREWWRVWPDANIGLDVGGAGMMAIDCDPGWNPEELERNIGALPKTKLVAKTPRGGIHYFFALDRDDEPVPPSGSKLAPSVDVRSFHSYVLLEPSCTVDGPYDWIEYGKPAFRSNSMYEVARSGARRKSSARDTWIIDADLPENLADCAAWLSGAQVRDLSPSKIAIEGQGGDNCAYATAAMCKSFGISEERAYELMLAHWNPRCVPPWGEDELDHLQSKVTHAYAYNTSAPGNVTEAYSKAKAREMFAPVEKPLPSGREIETGKFRFVDYPGMRHIKPAAWLIQDFLPVEAYCLMYGAPETYKTFLALDIALSIAVRSPLKPIWPIGGVRQGSVLFAAGEGRSDIAKRVEAWRMEHWPPGEADPDIVLVDPVPAPTERDYEGFIKGALEMRPQGYALVVMDTVNRSMQGMNADAQEAASRFTALTQAFRRELGAATLALHHTGHGNEHPRGSSVFVGDPDTLVRVDREQDYKVTLTMTKQKDAPKWIRPLAIDLAEIKLTAQQTSLVALPVPPDEKVKAPPVSKADVEAKHYRVTLDMLDGIVPLVLAENKAARWSQARLAEAIAVRDDVEVSSKTLQNRWLTELRESKDHEARRYYEPNSAGHGYWRWKQIGD